MLRYSRTLILLFVIVIFFGCSHLQIHYCSSPIQRLSKEIDKYIGSEEFSNANWGVLIQSADTGEIIYSRNAQKLFMPASNMKIFVSASALLKFGPDFKLTTDIFTDGKIEDGILKGNLIIYASGDPTIGYKDNQQEIFNKWAKELKAKGISKIEGDIIGNDDIFDDVLLGRGWSWDYLSDWYAAEISPFQFYENCIKVRCSPADKVGEPCKLEVTPVTNYISIVNNTRTVEKGLGKREIFFNRASDTNIIEITGDVDIGSETFSDWGTIHNPTLFFLTVLKESFERNEIEVTGKVLDNDDTDYNPNKENLTLLFSHQSPELKEILKTLMKKSQNLYSETLVRLLGYHYGKEGSFSEGRKVVQNTLVRCGIDPDNYMMADGCGVCRYNFISPEQIVKIYKYMYHHRYFKEYYDALPIAGVDGTIKYRMRGTTAGGNVRAKTGTIDNARALSGYATTKDGETIIFAMIVNNYLLEKESAEYIQDRVCELLTSFSRKKLY